MARLFSCNQDKLGLLFIGFILYKKVLLEM